MRAEVLRELMDELEASISSDEERERARRAVFKVAEQNGISCFDRDEQLAFAQHLLRVMREPRPVIRDRLMAHYGISRSQAYRVISECLELSQKPGLFGTAKAFNDDGTN